MRAGYVYFVTTPDRDVWKIGMTTDEPCNRLMSLQTGSPVLLSIYNVLRCEDADRTELELHRLFRHCRIHGEWFRATVDEIESAIDEHGYRRLCCTWRASMKSVRLPSKPCLRCGSTRLWYQTVIGDDPKYKSLCRLACLNCNLTTKGAYRTAGEAEEAWNASMSDAQFKVPVAESVECL